MVRRTARAAALAVLILGSEVSAFSLRLPAQQRAPRSKSLLKAHSGRRAAFAAAATALTTSLTANAAPADQRWAASEFFDEVRNGAVDRVTFAAEGGALVAVDCRAESKFHGAFRDATSAQWFHTGRRRRRPPRRFHITVASLRGGPGVASQKGPLRGASGAAAGRRLTRCGGQPHRARRVARRPFILAERWPGRARRRPLRRRRRPDGHAPEPRQGRGRARDRCDF